MREGVPSKTNHLQALENAKTEQELEFAMRSVLMEPNPNWEAIIYVADNLDKLSNGEAKNDFKFRIAQHITNLFGSLDIQTQLSLLPIASKVFNKTETKEWLFNVKKYSQYTAVKDAAWDILEKRLLGGAVLDASEDVSND